MRTDYVQIFTAVRDENGLRVNRLLIPDGLELSVKELKFCFIYCGKSFWAGETYELLWDIERTLHDQIKRILMENIRASEDEVDDHRWPEAKETA